MGCIVFKTCQLHRTVAQWEADGKAGDIHEFRDVIKAIAPRAWRHCSCGLLERIAPMLEDGWTDG